MEAALKPINGASNLYNTISVSILVLMEAALKLHRLWMIGKLPMSFQSLF